MFDKSINVMKNTVSASFLLLTSFVSVGHAQDFQRPPAKVQVVEAELRMMAPQISVTGSVISLNDSRLSSEVEGLMVWIADVGTAVNKGDVIARIDDRILAIAVRRAKANLKRLEADLVFQESDLARYQKLAEKDNTSQARLDATFARRDMLAQEVEDAKALLDQAEGDLSRASLRAPYAGHIVARLANVGEYITVGKEVVHLVDTQNLEVVMPAPLSIISFIKPGMMVEARDGEMAELLPVRTVVPVGHQVSRMAEVRLSMPANLWVVGAALQISLPKNDKREMVTVSRDALVLKGTDAMLFKVSSDMKAEIVHLDLRNLIAVGPWIALESGIEAGDKVIIRGAERLTPGQAVVISQ